MARFSVLMVVTMHHYLASASIFCHFFYNTNLGVTNLKYSIKWFMGVNVFDLSTIHYNLFDGSLVIFSHVYLNDRPEEFVVYIRNF